MKLKLENSKINNSNCQSLKLKNNMTPRIKINTVADLVHDQCSLIFLREKKFLSKLFCKLIDAFLKVAIKNVNHASIQNLRSSQCKKIFSLFFNVATK